MENKKMQKKKSKFVSYSRALIQLFCFILAPSLFISIYQSLKNIVMGVLHQSSSFATLIPDLLLVFVVTVITALLGRFFCGWMCAFGSMGDFIYKIRTLLFKKSKKIPQKIDQVLKFIKYIILFGSIVFIWGLQLVSVPAGVNPWDLFGVLLSFGNWPALSDLVQSFAIAGILLFGIIVGSFFVERFFCRYFCPLGAYFSLISKFRPLTIVKEREHCAGCSLCTKKCSMGIPLGTMDVVKSGECINCMECSVHCPKSNAHLAANDTSVNEVVVGAASCAVVLGAVYLGSYASENQIATSKLSSAAAQTVQSAITNAKWVDGTYEGTGTGFRGETTVSVTVSEGVISDIQILDSRDDAEYLNRASNQIVSDMLSEQTSDVDTVSGATYSSQGIIEAVKNALEGAATDKTAESSTDNVSNTSDSEETAEEEDSAQANSTEESSVTTDSTETADSTATEGSLSVADGTYEGSGSGFRGDTTVSVTVENGSIADITILSYQDDKEFFDRAVSTVISEIIANQDVNVDAVSGATYSSSGIMAAVADALNLSYTAPVIEEGRGRHR